MSLFGDIVDGDQVEQAVMAMLRLRLPTYLDEVAAQRGHPKGRGAYQSPKSWIVVKDFDYWPENKVPCMMVISPGMVDEPRRRGGGSYTGAWYVATAVVVSAKSEQTTHRLGMRYGAAVRACMLQNRNLEGAINGKAKVTEWLSEDYDDINDPEDERNLHAVRNIFTVEVKDITSDSGGPTEYEPDEPDGSTPDYGDWPTADPDKLEVDVQLVEEVDE